MTIDSLSRVSKHQQTLLMHHQFYPLISYFQTLHYQSNPSSLLPSQNKIINPQTIFINGNLVFCCSWLTKVISFWQQDHGIWEFGMVMGQLVAQFMVLVPISYTDEVNKEHDNFVIQMLGPRYMYSSLVLYILTLFCSSIKLILSIWCFSLFIFRIVL